MKKERRRKKERDELTDLVQQRQRFVERVLLFHQSDSFFVNEVPGSVVHSENKGWIVGFE